MMILLILSLWSALSFAQEAADSFEVLKPQMFQIKSAASATSEKSSYGTGWVVDKEGLLITNFHVIAEGVWNPKVYKIYLMEENQATEVAIETVDVIHDLALIRIPGRKFENTIPLSDTKPRNGEEIYSLGLPEDLDWTVVKGVYNGLVKQGPYELIHLTSPINSGMSGGPTVNKKNEIVGVNVSVLTSGQEVSFAVPVKYVRQLLESFKTRKKPLTPMEEIHNQLLQSQENQTEDLIKNLGHRKEIAGWSIPKLGQFIKCWGQGSDKDSTSHKYEREFCAMEHRTQLDESISTSFVQSEYTLLQNINMTELQFNSLLNQFWKARNGELRTYFSKDSMINYGPVRCNTQLVSKNKMKIEAQICMRPMVPFSNLFEIHIRMARIDLKKKVMMGYLTLDGFTADNMKKVLTAYMDGFGVEGNAKN